MKLSAMGFNSFAAAMLVIAGILLLHVTVSHAAPHAPSYPGYYMDSQSPEYFLARLRQALLAEEDLENSKRGLDLGLGRGFSGSQAAKHLMGLAAANFAGGPGRRRRSEEEA